MKLQPGEEYNDFSGRIIGKLTVIKRVDRPPGVKRKSVWWECQCDCGKTVIKENGYLSGRHLDRNPNYVRSCGCSSRQHLKGNFACLHDSLSDDLTGRRFTRLVVVHEVPRPVESPCRVNRWLCQCDCGKTSVVKSSHLKTGSVRSCGCLAVDARRRPHKNACVARIYNSYKWKSTRRNKEIEFFLELPEFEELITSNCHYCGSKPSKLIARGENKLYWNGIDRVNNNLGYISGNCVPCCEICNKAKRTMPVSEFREWVVRIYSHWVKES